MTYIGAPIINGCYANEDSYIGCGYDKVPLLFKKESQWVFSKSLDDGFTKTKQSKIGKDAFGGREVFFDGLELSNDLAMQEKETKHENFINCSKPFATDGGRVQLFSTSDSNGYIHFWEVDAV